jgi:predicted NBD/HSP70 family sugar kinase
MEETFERRIEALTKNSEVGRNLIFKVLTRVLHADPAPIARVEIARGSGLGDDFGRLSEGSVSRAVSHLIAEGFLEQLDEDPAGGSRAHGGVKLSRGRYRCIGIHVHSKNNRPTGLTGVMVGLAGNLIETQCVPLTGPVPGEAEVSMVRQDAAIKELVEAAANLVRQLIWLGGGDDAGTVLGVGVEIGGHVHAGTVVNATNENWSDVDLANLLENELDGLPVVLENDVNALAIWETHRRRFPETEMAVVALFPEGVGASLIVKGHVYRGGGGMAGEIGHLTVEYPASHLTTAHPAGDKAGRTAGHAVGELPRFTDPCPSPCHQLGHVDCLATPVRICGELGVVDFDAAALAPAVDATTGEKTTTGEVFDRAGTALGRGLVDLINLVNPSRVLLLVPDALSRPPRASAAAAYLTAMEDVVRTAFSTGAADARAGARRLTTRALTDIADLHDSGMDDVDADPGDVVQARAAAATVLEAFLARAAGQVRARRPGDEKRPALASVRG